ncbi:MAG: threonine synthase [Desulfitobacteriaceae bacterium]|nr:threonine synthase [Desulfitobacteriaceae bacterium]MDD4752654.1 threonine synthase [Desulfitobacteriaceae bacterium]
MYISTRGNYPKATAAEAIKLGMVPGGGLFVPERIPVLKEEKIWQMSGQTYAEVTQTILELFLEGYQTEEIRNIIRDSYYSGNFDHEEIAPLRKLDESAHVLELWHGPTAAFKDMALQIMPRLLSAAKEKTRTKKDIVILVATSGDTGKAALEGFKNVPGIKIIVFYPHSGVSKVQELQMTTTDGDNTYVVAVKGNFDDCQTAVKEIFADREFNDLLRKRHMEFSSANSINWGRLLPQIVYYFWSYSRLLNKGTILQGEKINVVVPTGNFGNILAGYYAYLMGLPVKKFLCASNENRVLTDVINTGVYDRRREFLKTSSPSMDILISSNFERFLFEMNGHDSEKINQWFKELNEEGIFAVDDSTRKKMQEIMAGDFATEEETQNTIKEVFESAGYLLDTHTAVGVRVYKKYVEKTQDRTQTVIDATANPYKFNKAVLEAIAGTEVVSKDEFSLIEKLHHVSGMEIHRGLSGLNSKKVLHRRVVERDELRNVIKEILGFNDK